MRVFDSVQLSAAVFAHEQIVIR